MRVARSEFEVKNTLECVILCTVELTLQDIHWDDRTDNHGLLACQLTLVEYSIGTRILTMVNRDCGFTSTFYIVRLSRCGFSVFVCHAYRTNKMRARFCVNI
jgi:hypothetical protein